MTPNEKKTLLRAEKILMKLAERKSPEYISSPESAEKILQYRLTGLEHEEFHVVFLTTRHGVIAVESMFRGTIDGASVHPREVAKRALELNAAAVIFAHNHPSGDPEPSQADIAITKRLQEALGLIDVRVLDHIIVGAGNTKSMAACGLM